MSNENITIMLKENALLLTYGDLGFTIQYDQYSQFRNATVEQMMDCHIQGDQAIWPVLDVDIDLRSLSSPQDFPLVSKK